MSSTSTMVYTAPPPTNNTLDRAERFRLLRSSRKLGAVLGATPFVVDPEADIPSSHILGLRRDAARGGLHSHTSSQTSMSSSTIGDSEYVFVNASSRSSPYQVQAIFDNASPSSSRSSSPFPGAVMSRATGGAGGGGGSPTSVTRKRKQDIGAGEAGLAPLNLNFALPGPAIAGLRKPRSGAAADRDPDASVAAGAHPSQPLLLRLRSVPAIATSESDTGHHHMNSTRTQQPGDSGESSPSSSKPLSPVSSSFNINMGMGIDGVPPSPSSVDFAGDHHAHGSLSDREKRRKLAKLARTLGENIPPELVFRAPASASNSSSSSSSQGAGPSAPTQPLKKLLRRTSSLTASKSLQPGSTSVSTPTHTHTSSAVDPVAPFNYYHGQPTSHSNKSSGAVATAASLPPLAVAAAPLPSPSSSPNANTNFHSHSHHQQQQRSQAHTQRHRPRSLTLGTASAFAFAFAATAAAAGALTRGSSAHAAVPASVAGSGKAVAPVLSPLRSATPRAPVPEPHAEVQQEQDEDEDYDSERTPTLESTRGFPLSVPVPHPSEYFARGSTSLDEPPFGPRSRSQLRSRPAPLTLSDQYNPRAQSYYAAGGAPFGEPLPSPRPFIHVAAPPPSDQLDMRASEDSLWSATGGTGNENTNSNSNANLKEWGRRKEREWSGEWNLKDMEDVARKLRGLKGR